MKCAVLLVHLINTIDTHPSMSIDDVLFEKIFVTSLTIISYGSFSIQTLHCCPSQMSENFMLSNSQLTSNSE